MADRFYSEGSKNNGAAGSDFGASSPKPQSTNPYTTPMSSRALGDFSENIDSNNAAKPRGYSQPQKKFEVHINNFDDFMGMPEPPSISEAPKPIEPKTRPAARQNVSASGRTAAASNQNTAKRPAGRVAGMSSAAKAKAHSKGSTPVRKKADTAKSRPISDAQKQKVKAKKRYNFVKTSLVACVCVFFISILTVSASTIAMQFINDILVIDKINGTKTVTIPEGSDFYDVFEILEEEGFVKQKILCKIFLLIREYDTVEYQPGVYYLDKSDGLEVNIETIMVRRSGSRDTVKLTFPEGWTIAQIFQKLEKYEVCEAEKLYANLEIVAESYGFIEGIGDSAGRYLKYEGYLFPDTYHFYIDENPASVIKKLMNNFDTKWLDEYDSRLKELGMTMNEIVTIASIIQREAKDSTQMTQISGVIHNRLNSSSTYPYLGMNSTKDYVTSLKSFKLFSDFYYELYLDSYNTYSNQGLPPSPICNPGAAAIKAALYPAESDYYFFMHDEDGEIYLARNAAEHQNNTEKYLYD